MLDNLFRVYFSYDFAKVFVDTYYLLNPMVKHHRQMNRVSGRNPLNRIFVVAKGNINLLLATLLMFGEKPDLSRRVRRLRPFDRAECKVCSLKGTAYCWRQCPYNVWRQRQIE